MKQSFFYTLLLTLLFWGAEMGAQTTRNEKNVSDSVDVLHYDLVMDLNHLSANQLVGCATVEMRLLEQEDSIALQLQGAMVDSVRINGVAVDFNYQMPLLFFPTSMIGVGDTFNCRVYYRSNGYVESYGWGGLHLDATLYYNLGVAFSDSPHNYGRTLFPCRDNFHDKATYYIHTTSPIGWTTQCTGVLDSAVVNSDGSQTTHWRIDNPLPTYLIGMAMADFHTVERMVEGYYGNYPATIAFRTEDSTRVASYFEMLDEVVSMYERCFGPYRWGRIGYVGTTKGSMEHATNIALVNDCIAAVDHELCISTTVHELGHAWFGNLVTCETTDEMWFNEGGATFTSEVAFEALFGKDYANDFYQNNLESVLRTTHITDGGYTALQGQTHEHVYGSTTYDKGGVVWHSLRGYLGDSLFYASMRQLFERNAFTSMNATAIRDSLSFYSATDLTDFFDFHVFSPGFQDFYVDSMMSVQQGGGYATTVALRQKLSNTTRYADGNRIPLTFVGADNRRVSQRVDFDGVSTQQTFLLPFEPKLVLVDFDRTFSDAVTSSEIALTSQSSTVTDEVTHFKVAPSQVNDTARLFVELHWSDPDLDGNPGIIRMAHHYWTVQGLMDESDVVRGFFGYGASGQFDRDLLHGSASRDSVRLLYRRSSSAPWQVVSAQTAGAYMLTKKMAMGEYTVAIVDESLLNIASADRKGVDVNIYPCPNDGGFKVDVDGYNGTIDVQVFDLGGHLVASYENCPVGFMIQSQLPTGSYVVKISNRYRTVNHVQKMVVKNF